MMTRLNLLAATALLIALAGNGPAPHAAEQSPARPRLLVIVVIDQMRQDYVDRMAPLWTKGMKRLLTEGAVFERNFYPYLQTVTCAGHATIGTGTFPSTHGIILNSWWRGTRTARCTDDEAVQAVGYEPGAEVVGHSAGQLLVPTLGDRLRARAPASRVVTLSTKPRSAIMLAGKGGVASWLDDHNVWATSTAYAAGPDADVQAYVSSHPRHALKDLVWERLLDERRYPGSDEGVGEKPPLGWTPQFPHPLSGNAGEQVVDISTLWEHSPYADAYLADMALDLVARKKLGQTSSVDLLGVSFAALDYVGHKFGPDSHEVYDTLLRLDHTIGDLLDGLDRAVGHGQYLVGLSSDHGVAPIPEARVAAGEDGGRIATQQLTQAANGVLVELLGPGTHVARTEFTQMYLTDAARAKIATNPGMLRLVAGAVERVRGVARVFIGNGLEQRRDSTDPLERAAALSQVPGRSGDLVVLPKPYYIIGGSDATTHGTHQAYDQHVPLIFFGPGVKPGRYQASATPADLAPTLAWRIALPMPGIDGVAHTSAFTVP